MFLALFKNWIPGIVEASQFQGVLSNQAHLGRQRAEWAWPTRSAPAPEAGLHLADPASGAAGPILGLRPRQSQQTWGSRRAPRRLQCLLADSGDSQVQPEDVFGFVETLQSRSQRVPALDTASAFAVGCCEALGTLIIHLFLINGKEAIACLYYRLDWLPRNKQAADASGFLALSQTPPSFISYSHGNTEEGRRRTANHWEAIFRFLARCFDKSVEGKKMKQV